MSDSKPSLPRRLLGRVKQSISRGSNRSRALRADADAASIFVTLTPRAKFPPFRRPVFTSEELLHVALAVGVRCTIDRLSAALNTSREAIAQELSYLKEMRADQEFVSTLDFSLGPDEDHLRNMRGEFRFSTTFLGRVLGTEPDEGMAVRLLTEAGAALHYVQEHKSEVSDRVDELGAHWYELEKYDSPVNGPWISRVTLYVHSLGSFVFVVMGESSSDIDVWVQFSRLANVSRDALNRVRDALVESRRQH